MSRKRSKYNKKTNVYAGFQAKVITVFAGLLLFAISKVEAQEMRIYSNGKCQMNIHTGEYYIPDDIKCSCMRYIEFTDYVLKAEIVELFDSIVDTIYYPLWGIDTPVKLAKIQIAKIIYNFNPKIKLSDYENPIDYHKLYNPTDSTIIAVKYLLYPYDMKLSAEECLIWVEAEYCNCYVLREIVDESIIFINRNSHYAGYYRESYLMKDFRHPYMKD